MPKPETRNRTQLKATSRRILRPRWLMWMSVSALTLLLLTGCYQQASDSFETIESQTSLPTPVNDGVIVIDPNAIPGEETDTDTATRPTVPTPSTANVTPADTGTSEETVNEEPAPAGPTMTPTVVIIQPQTRTPVTATPALPQAPGSLVATATQITLVTPEVASQIDFPTATATLDRGDNGLIGVTSSNDPLATPTGVPEGDVSCTYTIESGDTLFRIAINDSRFSLAELLAANDLTENSIIQPGQILVLPNCVPGETDLEAPPAIPTATPDLPAGTTLHVVASGETLGGIARRYGVTIADIMEANGLTNPDRLSIGQQLIIPTGNEPDASETGTP